MFRFRGCYVALVTPFYPDGSLNLKKLAELCEFQVQNGTDGLVVLGTTGESSTMSHEEDEIVVREALRVVNGRVPVIAGSGSNSTDTALIKSQAYARLGVDALLLITPYYNKANQRGMIRHFTEVADQVSVPVVLYNVPGRTGCQLAPASVEALSTHPNIAGIKEASGDMSYVMNIAHTASENFAIISGNDDITLPILSVGGAGVISVLSNICPRETKQIVERYFAGDLEGARQTQLKLLKLIRALFVEVNPIPVKTAMNIMGMNAGALRLPLCEMDERNAEYLKNVLTEYSLIGGTDS